MEKTVPELLQKKRGKRLNIYDFLHVRRVRLEKKDQTLKNICLH